MSWNSYRAIYGFGETSCPISLKQIFSKPKVSDYTNHFQLNSCYAFPKAILYKCWRSCKSEYPSSSFACTMWDDAVAFIDCGMFLSVKK